MSTICTIFMMISEGLRILHHVCPTGFLRKNIEHVYDIYPNYRINSIHIADLVSKCISCY